MALENNLVVDSDAELKAFLSSILSSEGIVVNINRTFIAYNNGTNRNRVFARCANRMAQKGTDEKFVVIALMCYPALNWILKARDIDAMIEQLHDMDTDGSVRNISEIQSLLENSTGYVKPRLHLEMRKLFFARCQQLVDAVDDAMNRAVFRSAQPCKPARISLAMAMLRGSILDSDPVSAVMIRNNFDGIIEDITKVSGEAIKELVLQLAPNEGVVQGAEAAYLYHNTEVLLREYSRITHPSSVDGNSTLRLIATAGNQLDPLAWWVSVILIVAASVLIYLNIPLLDDELWFDSCEFIKRPKQVKGKNSDSDVVASQASIILEEISEKYQDKGKSDKDYEQHQETSAKPTEKEPTKDSKKPETSAPINNNEPVNVKVNIHTEINPEPSEILDVLEDESEPIVPPAPKSASTPESADATKPFDAADIFEPEPELEPKPEKELVFDLPVDDDDTQDPFAEEDSDSPAGLSFDPSGVDMDDEKDPFADDDANVFNPPDDVDEHEEEPDMDMMDFDIPASSEPDTVDSPAIEQKPPMPDKVPEMPAKKTNAFGTLKAAATEPKIEPHESAEPVESHPTQPRPQKPDVPQTPKAEPKAEPVAPAQRPKADREAALAGFNITRKVEPSKEVKKPKKPITDKRTSTSKSSPKEDSAKAPKQKQPSKEAPAKSQKKPANEKQQNSDEPKKAQPFDQSFRKRGRGSSKKAQQSNGQISFEELH